MREMKTLKDYRIVDLSLPIINNGGFITTEHVCAIVNSITMEDSYLPLNNIVKYENTSSLNGKFRFKLRERVLFYGTWSTIR